eukprot:9700838-Alexandrium_andersonii.AAC.1
MAWPHAVQRGLGRHLAVGGAVGSLSRAACPWHPDSPRRQSGYRAPPALSLAHPALSTARSTSLLPPCFPG